MDSRPSQTCGSRLASWKLAPQLRQFPIPLDEPPQRFLSGLSLARPGRSRDERFQNRPCFRVADQFENLNRPNASRRELLVVELAENLFQPLARLLSEVAFEDVANRLPCHGAGRLDLVRGRLALRKLGTIEVRDP